MKLEIGKRYRTRGGMITPPMQESRSLGMPFGYPTPGNSSWSCFTETGGWLWDGKEDDMDLVAEHSPGTGLTEEEMALGAELARVYSKWNADQVALKHANAKLATAMELARQAQIDLLDANTRAREVWTRLQDSLTQDELDAPGSLVDAIERKMGQAASEEREARRYCRNADYFENLVTEIGDMFGLAAYISDDGSLHDEVLCERVPYLVERFIVAKERVLNAPHHE
jgi:hypothetical protein